MAPYGRCSYLILSQFPPVERKTRQSVIYERYEEEASDWERIRSCTDSIKTHVTDPLLFLTGWSFNPSALYASLIVSNHPRTIAPFPWNSPPRKWHGCCCRSPRFLRRCRPTFFSPRLIFPIETERSPFSKAGRKRKLVPRTSSASTLFSSLFFFTFFFYPKVGISRMDSLSRNSLLFFNLIRIIWSRISRIFNVYFINYRINLF